MSELKLVAINVQDEEARRRSLPFRVGRVDEHGNLEFTAAGRDRLIDFWRRSGKEGLPEAVKPLQGGEQILGLAVVDMGTEGRIPLKWGEHAREVWVDVATVLDMLDVHVPKDHWKDLKMAEHQAETWGRVLVCNLKEAPVRPKQRRVRRQPAPPAV